MDKTFDPAAVEARIAARWEEAEAFKAGPAGSAGRAALLDRHPAAERDGLAAHGPRPQQHAAGHPVPLRAHARHATCSGSPAPTMPASRRRWWSSASSWSARSDRRDLGREEFVKRVWEWKEESGGTIVNQLQAPRRLLRLVARALHDGRGPVARGAQGLRRPLQAGPDLQGQAPRQLGPEVPDRDLRPRGPAGRGQGPPLAHPLPDRGRAGPLHHRRDDAARDDARRHRRRGAPRGRALHAISSARTRSCRSSAGASRSSRTSIPTRRRAPAR